MGPYIGQEPQRSTIRAFLSRFTLSVSTGWGRTYYSHRLENMALIQKGGDSLFIFENFLNISNDTISTIYGAWLNNPAGTSGIISPTDTTNGIPINPGDFLVDTDTADIRLIGRGRNIPLDLSIHFNFDRYRVGIGATIEFHTIGSFRSRDFPEFINGFTPDFNRATFKRFYLMIGSTIIQKGYFTLAADLHIGTMNLGKNWNTAVMQKGIFANLGFSAEQAFSEYLSAFLRPSFEVKGYTISIPETDLSIDHNYNAIYINFGVRLRLPELKKCPFKSCATQINHVHWGSEYRSRKHPIWRWQNPHYGENYRKPFRNRWGNNRKINPY